MQPFLWNRPSPLPFPTRPRGCCGNAWLWIRRCRLSWRSVLQLYRWVLPVPPVETSTYPLPRCTGAEIGLFQVVPGLATSGALPGPATQALLSPATTAGAFREPCPGPRGRPPWEVRSPSSLVSRRPAPLRTSPSSGPWRQTRRALNPPRVSLCPVGKFLQNFISDKSHSETRVLDLSKRTNL
jgi:hypothetical protein